MQDFTKLKVWEKAHALTLHIYQLTSTFPQSELYGLTSQMRRSSASIPTNVAEGTGRTSNADFARFLDIALGSASELHYQIILAHGLQYLDEQLRDVLLEQIVEIKRMLARLTRRIRKSQ